MILEKIWNRIPRRFREAVCERLDQRLRRQCAGSAAEIARQRRAFLERQGRLILLEVVGLLALSIGLLVFRYVSAGRLDFARNAFGEGSREITLQLKQGKKSEKIELSLAEREPSKRELKALYAQFFKDLSREMCGENASLKQVETDLSFPDKIAGYPFSITYEPEDGTKIRADGSLVRERAADGDVSDGKKTDGAGAEAERANDEGVDAEKMQTSVTVRTVYGSYAKSHTYALTIVPPQKESLSATARVEAYLKTLEKKSRSLAVFHAPKNRGEIAITREPASFVGIFFFAAAVAVFLPVHNYFRLQEAGEQCQKEAVQDFPLLVHLLTLYMGAGLSFYSAVERIGRDYERRRAEGELAKERFAFEKMLAMERQIKTGTSQTRACQNFGRQFEADCYQRLALILTQSFTKGSREAARLMEETERTAFLERIDRAKREGEEAATKLLFPMILLLCQVMVLVMYPAIMRFQGF